MRTGVQLTALALMCAGMLAPSIAAAHTEKTSTSVTISRAGDDFGGLVDSSDSCTGKRKVSLLRRGEKGNFGKATSNGAGGWTVEDVPRENGDYYAKVAKRVLKSNQNHNHLCKPAKSKKSQDALVRDCDEVTLFDGSGGDGSQDVDVDDDLTVDVEGERRYTDLDGFANSYPPISDRSPGRLGKLPEWAMMPT